MKKLLIVHTNYQNKGGEDIAVEKEISFLKRNYEVKTLIFSNDIENIFNQIFSFLLNKNKKSMKKLNSLLDEFNPDIVYVHNTWFKASLGIFSILKKRNKKVIIKLHNFRYFCTKSYFLSKHLGNNEFCNACGLSTKSTKLINKYYTDSLLKSFLLIRYGRRYFNILKNSDITLLVLTQFHKKYLEENGFNKDRIHVLPNYIKISEDNKTKQEEDYIVYAGRVSKEKGVGELIEAFLKVSHKSLQLKIIGIGPDFDRLKRKYSEASIFFLGEKTNKETLEIIKNSKAVVTATKLFEGQPTLLCEASSLSVPAIFPETGGIAEFFPENYDFSFKQFNYLDLEKKISNLSKSNLSKIGQLNREYLQDYLNEKTLDLKFEEVIND